MSLNSNKLLNTITNSKKEEEAQTRMAVVFYKKRQYIFNILWRRGDVAKAI